MKAVSKWIKRLNTNVTRMNIRGTPRLLLLSFAGIFVLLGVLYVVGLLIELYWTGHVNYKAVNDFINAYYGVASVAAFGVIGKALIDSDGDGNPDVWEKEKENKDE